MKDQIILSISTVPDVESLRVIHSLTDLSDEGVFNAVLHLYNQRHGTRDLPLYQQQIVSISAVKLNRSGEVSLHHFESENLNEVVLLKRLDALMAAEVSLISWDMSALDQPLINYRLLKHGIVGSNFNGAINISLKDLLSNSSITAAADLSGLSLSLGLPDLSELTQKQSIDCYLNKQLQAIHVANQAQALNTCQIYLKSQMIKAEISAAEYKTICDTLANQTY